MNVNWNSYRKCPFAVDGACVWPRVGFRPWTVCIMHCPMVLTRVVVEPSRLFPGVESFAYTAHRLNFKPKFRREQFELF